MKTNDLADYNVGELKGLLQQIEVEIAGRQGKEAKAARDQIFKIAADLGMSVDELLGNKAGKKGATTEKAVNKAPVKYRNPDNSAEQWTGRGRRPKWVVDALDSGKNLEDLSV